jgi:hypothetical protein
MLNRSDVILDILAICERHARICICFTSTSIPIGTPLPFHAHVKGKTVRAYARGDLFDKRRALMQAWSDFSATGASVTPIRDGRHHDGVR